MLCLIFVDKEREVENLKLFVDLLLITSVKLYLFLRGSLQNLLSISCHIKFQFVCLSGTSFSTAMDVYRDDNVNHAFILCYLYFPLFKIFLHTFEPFEA